MHVPTDGWINGGWNQKLPQFRLLAEMLGLNEPSITPEDLQGLFHKVANAKVFAESIEPFLETAGLTKRDAAFRLEKIEDKLRLLEAIPFMSLRSGMSNPSDFDGVAIWPTGITNWTYARFEQIKVQIFAGAKIKRIICMNSTRICKAPADLRHPLLRGVSAGDEPTEREMQQQLAEASGLDEDLFVFPDLPDADDDGRVLSLEQQLNHLIKSGQYGKLIAGENIFVPSTPNSLYVPLHAARVLGHADVWFSQTGARLTRSMPDYWAPVMQDVMTTPNGELRLWVELQHAGCIKI